MVTPKKEIRLRVSETTYNAIKKVSKMYGYTLSQVVRFGLIDYLSKKGGYSTRKDMYLKND